jgi:hypothetical protein
LFGYGFEFISGRMPQKIQEHFSAFLIIEGKNVNNIEILSSCQLHPSITQHL